VQLAPSAGKMQLVESAGKRTQLRLA